MQRSISANKFQDFTAAVAEAVAEGLEVTVTRTSPPYEAVAEDGAE